MKKIMRIFLAITLLIFAISCKNTTEKKPVIEQPQQAEEPDHNEVENLKLNNGNLWEANSETTEGINTMLKLMSNFSDVENLEAYAVLKQHLEAQFKTIIQQCTMTGEAHNQLHVFIVPMKDLFNGLTTSDIEKNKENFNKLFTHLKTYKNYFN